MSKYAAAGLLFAVMAAVACGSETDGPAPPTGTDAGRADSGQIVIPDGGSPDAGTFVRDAAEAGDIGFRDPDSLLEGVHELNGLPTWVVMQGTLTSTMPPAILLHSGPGISSEYLLPHMKTILPGRLLVLYDMRASGRTSFGTLGTSTVTLAQHALDLGDVIDFVGDYADNTRVDLVAHGYGTAVAAVFAADNPGRVSRLILTTPYAADQTQLLERTFEENRRLSSADRMRLQDIRMRPECRQNISQCFLQQYAIEGPKMMCEDKRERFLELDFRFGDPRVKRFVETELRDSTFDLAPTFRRITAPTTIISGVCDTTPLTSDAVYATEIPDAVQHILSDSGHFPFVETSTSYATLLRGALTYP